MKRIAVFAYGTVAYLMFLGAFLYLIGFVGGIVVPKSIDSGSAPGLLEALLVNLVLVSLFGLQHSIMARPGFKAAWTKIIPEPIERSTFVLATNLILLLMFWQWRPMPGVVWEVESSAASFVLWAVFWSGWAIVLLSTFIIDHFDLFGMRQVFFHARDMRYFQLPFQVSAFYRYVRHPLLLGFMIAFWAAPTMTVGRLVFAGAMTTYMLVAIHFEERDLVDAYGKSYEDYRERVPMLVPMPGKGHDRVTGSEDLAEPARSSV